MSLKRQVPVWSRSVMSDRESSNEDAETKHLTAWCNEAREDAPPLPSGVGESMARKCPHGREHRRCKQCGGKTICQHLKERRRCKVCMEIDPEGKLCRHNKLFDECKICCRHLGKHVERRTSCGLPGGRHRTICKHGKVLTRCKPCGGGSKDASGVSNNNDDNDNERASELAEHMSRRADETSQLFWAALPNYERIDEHGLAANERGQYSPSASEADEKMQEAAVNLALLNPSILQSPEEAQVPFRHARFRPLNLALLHPSTLQNREEEESFDVFSLHTQPSAASSAGPAFSLPMPPTPPILQRGPSGFPPPIDFSPPLPPPIDFPPPWGFPCGPSDVPPPVMAMPAMHLCAPDPRLPLAHYVMPLSAILPYADSVDRAQRRPKSPRSGDLSTDKLAAEVNRELDALAAHRTVDAAAKHKSLAKLMGAARRAGKSSPSLPSRASSRRAKLTIDAALRGCREHFIEQSSRAPWEGGEVGEAATSAESPSLSISLPYSLPVLPLPCPYPASSEESPPTPPWRPSSPPSVPANASGDVFALAALPDDEANVAAEAAEAAEAVEAAEAAEAAAAEARRLGKRPREPTVAELALIIAEQCTACDDGSDSDSD